MSQNRADTKRSALAEQDFAINRRAETENRVLAQVLGLPLDEFEARVEAGLATALMPTG